MSNSDTIGGMSALARLRRLGNEWAKRPEIIEEARAEKATWQEIADALHMTPHGVRKLHATRVRPVVVWIDLREGGGAVLRAEPSSAFPGGREAELHRFVSIHHADSLAEIENVVTAWDWFLDGPAFNDEDGRMAVPIAPAR